MKFAAKPDVRKQKKAAQDGQAASPDTPLGAALKGAGGYAAGRSMVAPTRPGVGNLKDQLDSSGLTSTLSKQGRDQPDAMGGQTERHAGGKEFIGGSSGRGFGKDLADVVGQRGPVTGQRHGDTFGAGRVNGRFQGGEGAFKGDGKGKAMDGSGMQDGDRTIVGVGPGKEDTGMGRDEFAATLAAQLQAEGGKSSGSAPADAAELAYAQSVGSEGYAATKDMSPEQRAAYWTAQQKAQATGTDGSQATTTSSRNKTGREREDAMGSGGPSIASEVATAGRGIAGKKGGAGGANDGRTEQQGSGGTALVTRNKAGGAERVKGQGKLNRDAMLRINQLVNPGAR